MYYRIWFSVFGEDDGNDDEFMIYNLFLLQPTFMWKIRIFFSWLSLSIGLQVKAILYFSSSRMWNALSIIIFMANSTTLC